MKIFTNRKLKLRKKIEICSLTNDIDGILKAVDEYEKDNLSTIEKLKRKRQIELNRINGALKQTINAHSVITKQLIGSASKRIYGSLLADKTQKQKIFDKLSRIYLTFYYCSIFIIKLEFMKVTKNKISITISDNNNKRLINESTNKSKLIDKLLTKYFNDKDEGMLSK